MLDGLHVFSWRETDNRVERLPLAARGGAWLRYLQLADGLPGSRFALLEFVRAPVLLFVPMRWYRLSSPRPVGLELFAFVDCCGKTSSVLPDLFKAFPPPPITIALEGTGAGVPVDDDDIDYEHCGVPSDNPADAFWSIWDQPWSHGAGRGGGEGEGGGVGGGRVIYKSPQHYRETSNNDAVIGDEHRSDTEQELLGVMESVVATYVLSLRGEGEEVMLSHHRGFDN